MKRFILNVLVAILAAVIILFGVIFFLIPVVCVATIISIIWLFVLALRGQR